MTEAELKTAWYALHERNRLADQLAKIDASTDNHVFVQFSATRVSVSKARIRGEVAEQYSQNIDTLQKLGITA